MSNPFEDSILDKVRRVEQKAASVSNEVTALGDHMRGADEALKSRLDKVTDTLTEVTLSIASINATLAREKSRTDAIAAELRKHGLAEGV